MTNPNNLELKKPAIFFILLLIIIFILIVIASIADKSRKENVWQKYKTEADQYILENRPGLEKIFNEVFADNLCTKYVYDNSCINNSGQRGASIAALIKSNLKDYSSTMFIKKDKTEKLLLMRLSGEISEVNISDIEKLNALNSVIDGKTDYAPWDDYFYALRTKEVLIPVKDGQNKTIGILVRGVIE